MYHSLVETVLKQECIPVGCVLPAAVAVCCRGCLPQCMLGYTPLGLDLDPPNTPRCGPGDHPLARPPNLPLRVWAWRLPNQTPQPPLLGVGLDTAHGQTSQPPPWAWAWRHPLAGPLNLPPGCGPGEPPL